MADLLAAAISWTGSPPVAIDQSGTIRCAVTGRTLFIAPGSSTDRANPGAAELLNPHTSQHCTR